MTAQVATVPPRIDPLQHLGWAAAIGLRIAKAFKFSRHSQDAYDVIQVAHLTLCKKASSPKFQADRADESELGHLFRGWAGRSIESECKRECRRLKNAGTYSTRREGADTPPVGVVYTSDMETPGGEPIPLIDYRGLPVGFDLDDSPPAKTYSDDDLLTRLFA